MSDARVQTSLATRLAVAFVAVAVVAVATLAVVMLLTTRSETRRTSERDRAQAAQRAAGALARAYRVAGSWAGADTSEAVGLAAREGAVLVVRGATGAAVISPGRGPGAGRRTGAHRSVATAPVVVTGRRVGTVELRFPTALTAAEQRLRDKLAGAALIGSLVAVAIALLVAGLVWRRLALPLRRLTGAARRLRAGDLGARAEDAHAPGELGELAEAFDGMAAGLEDEEEARRRLVTDLSHEVRTPLTVLRGNLEALIDGVEQPTPERLGSLHEEVLRLESLVEQLDALRRAGVPMVTLHLAPLDLAEVAAAEVAALAPQFAAKDLRVSTTLTAGPVRGDRAKLGQVVSNLLSNALKFAPEHGHVEIAVRVGDDAVDLEVDDDGPGIAAADRDRVFERFWRGPAAESVAGRGIGLAVVDEIVRAHGGTVAAGQGSRGGARLTVTLPLEPPAR